MAIQAITGAVLGAEYWELVLSGYLGRASIWGSWDMGSLYYLLTTGLTGLVNIGPAS